MGDKLDDHIWALGFPPWAEVSGAAAVARLVAERDRHGVYVLGFATGERYVGRAIDVVRRFAQHELRHHDIERFTFKPVAADEIAREERRCIHELEARGVPLRNFAEMSVIRGDSPFDDVIPPHEQDLWLTGEPVADGPRQTLDPDLRRRYRTRFERYRHLPDADDVSLLLGAYLDAAIPFPNRTELSFWSMSCLPTSDVYSRINVNMQEVLTLQRTDDGPLVSLHVAKSPFEAEFGAAWQRVLEDWQWPYDLHAYKPGGGDQFRLFADRDLALSFMMDPLTQRAMSLLNLRLMRKGPTYYATSHCIDLVADAHTTYARRKPELDTRHGVDRPITKGQP